MKLSISVLKRKSLAATQGPWQWYGNTKTHEVYLATINRGRVYVMDFVRWGMRLAQPRFQLRTPDPTSGGMRSVGELGAIEHSQGPRFEASHRRQFAGIGHPDADYIASFSPDVTGRLLAVAEAAKCWLDSNDEDRQEELNVLIASLENVEL